MTKRQAYLKAWHKKHPRYASRHGKAYYAKHRKHLLTESRKYLAQHRKQNAESCGKYYAQHRAEAAWRNMHTRCVRPVGRNAAYALVKVCKRWSGPYGLSRFLKDMGPCSVGKSISRFGDTGDYKPSNCAWHTRAQQREEHRKKKEN